jgi:squalene-hopene/tetraprenyl-beta-curcumene cyclase
MAAGQQRGPDPKEVQAALERAVTYLTTHQGQDGSFAPRLGGPGVSALVAAGLLRNGRTDAPLTQKTLTYLEKSVKPDGGIYDRGLANYTTSVALIAFHEANARGKYDAIIANATKFLKSLQVPDDGSMDPKDARFGGVGYDGRSRPDLSNTHFFLDALEAAGVSKNDPAVQRALIFINRCQNLPSEHNSQPFALKTTPEDRGGFAYTPTEPRQDDPRRTADGGLRSEGGMTYAGLKSFLYAGVNRDDPRVKSAVDWIRKHYTLEENVGQGTAGLYYYYLLFAKAMDAFGEDPFVDSQGKPHDWRAELFGALKKRQRPDGSWSNENNAFQESTPELATAYAILAMSYCVPAPK